MTTPERVTAGLEAGGDLDRRINQLEIGAGNLRPLQNRARDRRRLLRLHRTDKAGRHQRDADGELSEHDSSFLDPSRRPRRNQRAATIPASWS
jgi:hypothetical protein